MVPTPTPAPPMPMQAMPAQMSLAASGFMRGSSGPIVRLFELGAQWPG
jgi:hypothetical protein